VARVRALVVASVIAVAGCRGAEHVAGTPHPPTGASTTTTAPSVTTTDLVSTTISVPTTTTVTATTSPSSTSAPAAPTGPALRVYGGNPNRREVALTFDAGSDTGYTAQILDVLGAEHITATFSLTGQWAEANPDLVRRIAADGHQLMNHSYDHRSFTGRSTETAPLTFAARRDELARTESVVARVAGVHLVPWFRPPYGDTDASVDRDLGRLGYRYDVLWTVDSLGWKGLSGPSIVQRCLERAVPGAIFLFHVGSASQDAAALPSLINGLRRAGYGFDSVARLLGGTP
jgi:peptidoglycan-N-acetylglucosamine deacetylase